MERIGCLLIVAGAIITLLVFVIVPMIFALFAFVSAALSGAT